METWAFHFKEYLTKGANPSQGIARQFTLSDLPVLAYVFTYWEDDPDFENIEVGLRRGEYQEQPYNDFLTSVTPLFQEPPEELDETWVHGSLMGGIVDAFDTFTLADSYKLAGDMLVDTALSAVEVNEFVYPIIYSYRHATELYLKAILSPKKRNHNLEALLQKLHDYLKREHATVIPTWFENVILAFAGFDPDSTTFRYGEGGVFSRRTDGGEFWVDLPHIKRLMGWVAESCQRIRHRQRLAIEQTVRPKCGE